MRSGDKSTPTKIALYLFSLVIFTTESTSVKHRGSVVNSYIVFRHFSATAALYAQQHEKHWHK